MLGTDICCWGGPLSFLWLPQYAGKCPLGRGGDTAKSSPFLCFSEHLCVSPVLAQRPDVGRAGCSQWLAREETKRAQPAPALASPSSQHAFRTPASHAVTAPTLLGP